MLSEICNSDMQINILYCNVICLKNPLFFPFRNPEFHGIPFGKDSFIPCKDGSQTHAKQSTLKQHIQVFVMTERH